MLNFTNKKDKSSERAGYNTPLKNQKNNYQQPQTAIQTDRFLDQLSLQNSHHNQFSNTSTNIFKRRRYHKVIKQSNFKLLLKQKIKLQSLKFKSQNSESQTVKQAYQDELNKVYVVIGKITKIQEQKRSYVIQCIDDTVKQFKLYHMKPFHLEENRKKKTQKYASRKIINVDEVEFQNKPEFGTPYFKFFIYFREVPTFQKSQIEVLNSQNHELNSKQNSNNKKIQFKIKDTELKIYIKHFEKITDFNQLAWHNLHICFQHQCQVKVNQGKLQIQD